MLSGAGRDGEAADCLLLYSAGDIQTAKFLIESSSEGLDEEKQANVRRRDYERLQAMIGYCKTSRCLRGYILDYFGQKHPENCGCCGNCKGAWDIMWASSSSSRSSAAAKFAVSWSLG